MFVQQIQMSLWFIKPLVQHITFSVFGRLVKRNQYNGTHYCARLSNKLDHKCCENLIKSMYEQMKRNILKGFCSS